MARHPYPSERARFKTWRDDLCLTRCGLRAIFDVLSRHRPVPRLCRPMFAAAYQGGDAQNIGWSRTRLGFARSAEAALRG